MQQQVTQLEMSPGALPEYYDWLKEAKHGETIVYWQGDLQYDRQVVIPAHDVMRAADRLRLNSLNVVADRVREDADNGLLLLTQKRLGFAVYEYRATRVRQTFSKAKHPNEALLTA
jgi:hypothetical protein